MLKSISPPRLLLQSGLLSVMVACTSIPKLELSPEDIQQRWAKRQSDLSGLQSWRFKGRVSFSTQQESWSSTIHWQQRPDFYDVRFMATLGQTQAELHGDMAGVVLRLPDETITAADATILLRENLGWTVPIDGLRYWVLGLPRPDVGSNEATYKKALDSEGRLAWLEQSGWHIEYKKYYQRLAADLPKKIIFTHPELRLKLVIHQWQHELVNPDDEL